MLEQSQVEAVIFRALANLNAERPADDQIEIHDKTPLFGGDSQIDSLSLVSVIVDVETTLNADHGMSVSLADDRALARPVSPYTDVSSLRDYILELARGQ